MATARTEKAQDSARSRVLPGLHLAARSLQLSMRELSGGAPFPSIDARRLCAASLSAGRVIGYLEALEAMDVRLAQSAVGELGDVFDSVEEVRRQFGVAASET